MQRSFRHWFGKAMIFGCSLWMGHGWLTNVACYGQQSRLEKVLGDKLKFESQGLWYYNDLKKGFETAKKTGQPVLVVLRCVPCEECVKLDDDLVEANPKLQQLLKSFVRVRIVGTNGLDLSLFQFDTDQSFAVFIFNGDGTLYGRYGTRSDRIAWEDDVSVDGLGAALEKALALHREYPSNRAMLVGKQPDRPPFPTPEKIPPLASKFTDKLDYEGNVVKSCIHCHMIGDAMREHLRGEHGKLPVEWLFPYPHPKSIGLIFDPAQAATVKRVTENTEASDAGFQAGDRLETLNGQAILSMADVQWVLHHMPSSGGRVQAQVQRGDKSLPLTMELKDGWRSREEISWRASVWPMRQKGFGGMVLKPATPEERAAAGLVDAKMAMTVQHVGSFAPHDRAKKAGLQKGDVVFEFDGRSDFARETDLLVHALNEIAVGGPITVRYRRGTEEKTATLTTSN